MQAGGSTWSPAPWTEWRGSLTLRAAEPQGRHHPWGDHAPQQALVSPLHLPWDRVLSPSACPPRAHPRLHTSTWGSLRTTLAPHPAASRTQEGRGGDGSVAAGHHHADACLHEGHGEVHNLGAFLVDGEGADGHVCPLVVHLRVRPRSEEELPLPCWPSRPAPSTRVLRALPPGVITGANTVPMPAQRPVGDGPGSHPDGSPAQEETLNGPSGGGWQMSGRGAPGRQAGGLRRPGGGLPPRSCRSTRRAPVCHACRWSPGTGRRRT